MAQHRRTVQTARRIVLTGFPSRNFAAPPEETPASMAAAQPPRADGSDTAVRANTPTRAGVGSGATSRAARSRHRSSLPRRQERNNDPQRHGTGPDRSPERLSQPRGPPVGESVQENNTIEHIQQLLDAAKNTGHLVAVSPHYYYPWDDQWQFGGTLEKKMHEINMYKRKHPLRTDDLEGSGADFLEQFKPHLEDGETVVCSPHKVYGPQQNDLALQLRKRGITRVLLAGMSANLREPPSRPDRAGVLRRGGQGRHRRRQTS